MKSIVPKLKQLTANNHHGAALILIAESCGFSRALDQFRHIEALCNIDGYLNQHLSAYRFEVYQQMMQDLLTYHPSNYDAIKGVL